VEIDTNIDTRFPPQRVLLPGLIRETTVYFEKVLAGRTISEIVLQKDPLVFSSKENLISLQLSIVNQNGDVRTAGSIPLGAYRHMADDIDYALGGLRGRSSGDLMGYNPSQKKLQLTNGEAVQINDLIHVTVDHYL